MKNGKPVPIPVRVKYSCKKCPAYCCTYDHIEVTERDLARIARHLGLDPERSRARFAYFAKKEKAWMLRHRRDRHFGSACAFLDPRTRQCGIYDARPAVCRKYPDSRRCGYYDFLSFEREQHDDPEFVART